VKKITASLVSFESSSESGIYFAAKKKKKIPHEENHQIYWGFELLELIGF
jgi:hypothetical protein